MTIFRVTADTKRSLVWVTPREVNSTVNVKNRHPRFFKENRTANDELLAREYVFVVVF